MEKVIERIDLNNQGANRWLRNIIGLKNRLIKVVTTYFRLETFKIVVVLIHLNNQGENDQF